MESDTDIHIWSDERLINIQICNQVSNLRAGQEFKHMPQNQAIRNKTEAF